MLSWIFRHRLRLQVIYGAAPLPPLPGTRFAAVEERSARRGRAPGTLRRSGGALVVVPMGPARPDGHASAPRG